MAYSNLSLEERIRLRKKKRKQKRIIFILLMAVILISMLTLTVMFSAYDKKTSEKNNNIETNDNAVEVSKEIPEDESDKKEEKNDNNDNIEAKDYSDIYYYESKNQDRYVAYQKSKPNLSASDVVWQVNACLDKPFYGYDVNVTDINDKYVIVNKYYKLSKGNEPKNLVTADGYSMTKETAEAYKKMKADAASNGFKIACASAYRSISSQESIYKSYLNRDPQSTVDTYSARAGYSEHHTGMAIDFVGEFGSLEDFAKTKAFKWVSDNCYKYGFIIRYTAENQWATGYKSEPWHLRYIGVDAATDMKNKNVCCFEEYKVKYIEHKEN